MRKFLSMFLSIIFLFGITPLPVNAISVNYSEKFDKECVRLWSNQQGGSIYNSNLPSNNAIGKYDLNLYSGAILWYLQCKYELTKDLNEGTVITVSADWFESIVNKHFANVDFNMLLESEKFYLSYNEIERTYDWLIGIGGGGSRDFHFIGYTRESDNRYALYGCTIDNAYEKTDNAVEGKDYITVLGYDNKLWTVELLSINKIILSYENDNVKFYSWENISNFPNISNLITYDTNVDTLTDNTSSINQSSTTPSSISNPNSSNQNQSQNSSKGIVDSTPYKSSSSTTSALQNSISSNQDMPSQTNTENSSSTTYTEASNSASDTVETDKKESTIEDSKQSNATNNSNENHKSNNLNIILAILSVVVLLGCGIAIYLLKFKTK